VEEVVGGGSFSESPQGLREIAEGSVIRLEKRHASLNTRGNEGNF
jgi:hypothetical protein